MDGFVDDSNGQINSFNEDNTISNLHDLVQKARFNAIPSNGQILFRRQAENWSWPNAHTL